MGRGAVKQVFVCKLNALVGNNKAISVDLSKQNQFSVFGLFSKINDVVKMNAPNCTICFV